MAAIFLKPMPFVASSASPAPVAGSVANLNSDVPNMVWRGTLTTSIIVDLGASPGSYDTVALVGSNLRATDTIAIETGTTTSGQGSSTLAAQPAFTGSKGSGSTMSVITLPAARTERYVRVTINATGHPAGFTQVQRLVIAPAVSTAGIEYEAEYTVDDQSVVESGPGYETVDEYAPLSMWKITTPMISEVAFRNTWNPILNHMARKRGILFIPDDQRPDFYQTDAIFARMLSKASGRAVGFEFWSMEMTLRAIAP